jgi:glucokinase
MDPTHDARVIMTLDAGGTNFRFCALRGSKPVTPTVALPSNGDNLEKCLANIVEGFARAKQQCPEPPVAISFVFPAPADYPLGIIGDLGNLPGFRGGVPLGPMLEHRFGIPTFINNDADMFVYGEALAGFLPYVNRLLEKAGSAKRFRNLFGVTLGTGFGAGITRNGEPFFGDNSMAGEIWLLRNKLKPETNAEEGASIRAVRHVYAAKARIPLAQAPEPKDIFEIGLGTKPGDQAAAGEAFRQLGEVVGDAMAQALTLVDGLAVIGGGISGAAPLFLPALVNEINSTYLDPQGQPFRRLTQVAFNLEDPAQLQQFLQGEQREITVPGSGQKLRYDPLQRIGVGMSRLGTSEATAIGAYAFALRALDARQSALRLRTQ